METAASHDLRTAAHSVIYRHFSDGQPDFYHKLPPERQE